MIIFTFISSDSAKIQPFYLLMFIKSIFQKLYASVSAVRLKVRQCSAIFRQQPTSSYSRNDSDFSTSRTQVRDLHPQLRQTENGRRNAQSRSKRISLAKRQSRQQTSPPVCSLLPLNKTTVKHCGATWRIRWKFMPTRCSERPSRRYCQRQVPQGPLSENMTSSTNRKYITYFIVTAPDNTHRKFREV